MDEKLNLNRRSGTSLLTTEIEAMIFLCQTGKTTPAEVAKANSVELKDLLLWQTEYRTAGLRKLRRLPTAAESALHEKIAAQSAYIKELERILGEKREASTATKSEVTQ